MLPPPALVSTPTVARNVRPGPGSRTSTSLTAWHSNPWANSLSAILSRRPSGLPFTSTRSLLARTTRPGGTTADSVEGGALRARPKCSAAQRRARDSSRSVGVAAAATAVISTQAIAGMHHGARSRSMIGPPDQPLIPVSRTPWMKVRCVRKNSTIRGVITIIEAAMSMLHSVPPCWL